MIKVGILGGVFDPVHIGHLHIADGVLRVLGLNKIYFVPAGEPPHKANAPIASGEHRIEMLRIAIRDNPAFDLLDLEIKRPGKSYSVDTLTQLRNEHPEWDLHFVIGADNLNEMLSWKDPERIFKLSTVILVNRPGTTGAPADADLPGKVFEVQLPGLGISSTEIRRFVKEGTPVRYLLPPRVEEFIMENRLYR